MSAVRPYRQGRVALAVAALLAAVAAPAPCARAQEGRSKQEILIDELPARTVGDAPFEVAAKATSGLPVTLEVISGPAVLDGKKLKLTGGPGLVILRASQEGNALFLPAASAERAFSVRPVPSAPVVVVQPVGMVVGIGEPILLSASATGEPEPAFQWRKDGMPITGATGRALTLNAASPSDSGMYDVRVYNSAGEAVSARVRVTVGKRHQTITFQPPGTVVAGQPVSLSATATSGLQVRFDVVSGVGALSGDILTSQGGTVVVQASQPGDTTFEPAIPVSQAFTFVPGIGQRVP